MTAKEFEAILRKEARRAYRRARRAGIVRDKQYFYKETKYGRKKFYRRLVTPLCISKGGLSQKVYLIDRRGNVYHGIQGWPVHYDSVYAGHSWRSVEQQMDMHVAEQQGFQRLDLRKESLGLLRDVFGWCLVLAPEFA